MTLDGLITALALCAPRALVEIDGEPVGEFDSYRGYYNQLALGTGLEPITAAELLTAASAAKGKVFQGYKGGDYLMTGDTAVWFAEYGYASGIAIVGVDHEGDTMRLLVADISEYA